MHKKAQHEAGLFIRGQAPVSAAARRDASAAAPGAKRAIDHSHPLD
jgi:hypothetical protein